MNTVISFVIALVSGMGLGGGGLFAVYLSLFTDVPQLSVQGFNLVFFLFAAGASVVVQLFKRKVNFTAVAIMTAAGLVGAALGVAIGGALPEEWLRRIFGLMLITVGILSLRSAIRKPDGMNSRNKKYSENSSTNNAFSRKKSSKDMSDKGGG